MLRRLEVTNFTAFGRAELRFSTGLNVIVGENGLGKSHLLKLPYAVMAASAEEGRKRPARAPAGRLVRARIAEKLVNVFRPEFLGRLARRRRGRSRCEAVVELADPGTSVGFGFSSASQTDVAISRGVAAWCDRPPVFLPTRELMTVYPGFVSLYDTRKLEFDETWRDTCVLLGDAEIKDTRSGEIQDLVGPLEERMGGQLVLDANGRFYLKRQGARGMEMPLVAEGWRKLGMLARLVMNGSLRKGGCLFWDEPEANLNPRLIREVAGAILGVCRSGVQAIVATHSLFLLREFEILLGKSEFEGLEQRYFSLQRGGGGVEVSQGGAVDDIDPLVLLEEELAQSDRFMEKINA